MFSDYVKGACNKTQWTVVNRKTENLDGFNGVTLTEYGMN